MENNMYMYEIQYKSFDKTWQASGNESPNRFITKEEAYRAFETWPCNHMDYRVARIGESEDNEFNLIKLKAKIKAILTEPSKLQRIAKLLEEK
jgi:hypothetical protein